MEQVNHPKHYNQHPAGIECIDIIRHYVCDIANAIKYLWRAGLKPEIGKEDAEKEIEDLEKALWYIEDYYSNFNSRGQQCVCMRNAEYHTAFKEMTGYTIEDVCSGYPSPIKEAMTNLLFVGLVHNGCVVVCSLFSKKTPIDNIQQRILDIDHQLLSKELERATKTMNAFMTGQSLEAVDGEDYVLKPGCVRETEPEKYDPLNMIVAWGRVYCLTDEIRKKKNGALYGPCDNCALSEYCVSQDGTESLKNLCNLHGATDQQYYREVGKAKYKPYFGTVEVVDEQKEMDLELKRLDEEDDNI